MRFSTLFEHIAVASGFVLLASPLNAQRAGGHPDVTGVWRMDTTKFEWAILTRVQHVVDETIGRVSQQRLVFTRR